MNVGSMNNKCFASSPTSNYYYLIKESEEDGIDIPLVDYM